jgi:hypothetical protein
MRWTIVPKLFYAIPALLSSEFDVGTPYAYIHWKDGSAHLCFKKTMVVLLSLCAQSIFFEKHHHLFAGVHACVFATREKFRGRIQST